MKALFIPLKTAYFEAFARGTKTSEFRVYGARWNERTCFPGRSVVLSKGYGNAARLRGVVVEFRRRRLSSFAGAELHAIWDCFGTAVGDIAEIVVKVDRGNA
jgi:hypothetical protein